MIDGKIQVLVSAMTITGKIWRWPENEKNVEMYNDEKDVIKNTVLQCVIPMNTRRDFKIDDCF